jgi:hypothetical protein
MAFAKSLSGGCAMSCSTKFCSARSIGMQLVEVRLPSFPAQTASRSTMMNGSEGTAAPQLS